MRPGILECCKNWRAPFGALLCRTIRKLGLAEVCEKDWEHVAGPSWHGLFNIRAIMGPSRSWRTMVLPLFFTICELICNGAWNADCSIGIETAVAIRGTHSKFRPKKILVSIPANYHGQYDKENALFSQECVFVHVKSKVGEIKEKAGYTWAGTLPFVNRITAPILDICLLNHLPCKLRVMGEVYPIR